MKTMPLWFCISGNMTTWGSVSPLFPLSFCSHWRNTVAFSFCFSSGENNTMHSLCEKTVTYHCVKNTYPLIIQIKPLDKGLSSLKKNLHLSNWLCKLHFISNENCCLMLLTLVALRIKQQSEMLFMLFGLVNCHANQHADTV